MQFATQGPEKFEERNFMAASTPAIIGADRIMYNGAIYPVQYAAINASSANSNTVVSDPGAGLAILGLMYDLVANNNVTITLESSDGTVHDGPISVAANGGKSVGFSDKGHWKTVSGKGVVLFLGGAVQVGGHLAYATVAG